LHTAVDAAPRIAPIEDRIVWILDSLEIQTQIRAIIEVILQGPPYDLGPGALELGSSSVDLVSEGVWDASRDCLHDITTMSGDVESVKEIDGRHLCKRQKPKPAIMPAL